MPKTISWEQDDKNRILDKLTIMLRDEVPRYPDGDGCSDEIAGWITRAIERIQHDDNGVWKD